MRQTNDIKVIGAERATGSATNAKNWDREATPELKQAVVETAGEIGIDVQEIMDISGLTNADIQDTLFMKFMDGKLFKPKYKFLFYKLFGLKTVRLGNEEYKYHDLSGDYDALDIEADNSIDDFNGTYIAELAEVYKLDEPFHKKVKLPELVLTNAWLVAAGMIEFVQIQIEEMTYAIERKMENMAARTVFANATAVELPFGSEAIDYNKAAVQTITDLGTTSNAHLGLGAITISTVAGDVEATPDLYFEPSEFVLFVDTEQFVDITFENDAQWFNYAATKLNWAEVKPLAFSKYTGFQAIGTDAAVDVPAGLKMIAIHKESVELLEQYDYRAQLKGRGPWVVDHTHKNLGTYKVKTKPIYTFVEAEEVVEPSSIKASK